MIYGADVIDELFEKHQIDVTQNEKTEGGEEPKIMLLSRNYNFFFFFSGDRIIISLGFTEICF